MVVCALARYKKECPLWVRSRPLHCASVLIMILPNRVTPPSNENHLTSEKCTCTFAAHICGSGAVSSGYKLNFNSIWVLHVEGVIVVAAVGERIPFVVETGTVVV